MDVRRTGSNAPASGQSNDDRRADDNAARTSATTPESQVVSGPLQGLARRGARENDPGHGMIEHDARLAANPLMFQSLDAAFAAPPRHGAGQATATPAGSHAGSTAPRPTQAATPRTRPRLRRAQPFAPAHRDPRQQLIESDGAPGWQQHMFQGFGSIMDAQDNGLAAALASAPPPSMMQTRGDLRSQDEIDHTASLHQARPTLGLYELADDRAAIGTGTPAQIAQAHTYVPRLEQAEALIHRYLGAGDDDHDDSALPPFRALAQQIGGDVMGDQDDESVSPGDYLRIMDQLAVMYRRVPDDA